MAAPKKLSRIQHREAAVALLSASRGHPYGSRARESFLAEAAVHAILSLGTDPVRITTRKPELSAEAFGENAGTA